MPPKKAPPRRPSGSNAGRVVDLPVKKRASSRKETAKVADDRDPKAPYIRISQKTADLLRDTNWDEWDDEELRRGQRKVGGQFRGPPPAIIPRGAYNALVERTISHCMEIMRENMPDLINELVKMAQDDSLKASDRIKIIEMMMDRIFGKPKERKDIALTGANNEPWRGVLDVAIVSDDGDSNAS